MHIIDSRQPTDQETGLQAFLNDVVAGLQSQPRRLPCKYFYDERGSQLFDQICELDEYYLTRTELAIMTDHAEEMAAQIGEGVMLVEYGSGSSVKTHLLLKHLERPAAYVPVDISGDHLQQTAEGLSRRYPHLEVLPVHADFTQPFRLPKSDNKPTHHAVYFPGSTIGNFEPAETKRMLKQVAHLCGRGGGLLIGIDLQKDPAIIERAYNDAQGVTAAFNRNLLYRVRNELGADIEPEQFEHRAVYNSKSHRMEIYLVSRRDQQVRLADRVFEFSEGEKIHTENSHKYTIEGFAELAAQADLTLHRAWTDSEELFAVLHLAIE